MSFLILLCVAGVAISDSSFFDPSQQYGQPPIYGNCWQDQYGNPVGDCGSRDDNPIDRCFGGKILHVDGTCVTPIVNRRIYLYEAPRQHHKVAPLTIIPQPRVDYNFVLVRTPERHTDGGPIVVPPPRQKTIVYVLNKKSHLTDGGVIEVPHTVDKPEVYYVNYNEGDNPTLPGGIDLRTALKTTISKPGVVIGEDHHTPDDSVVYPADQYPILN